MKLETNQMMKGLCAFAAVFTLAACTGKSSNNPAPAVTPQEEGMNNEEVTTPAPEAGPGEVAPAPEASLPSSGNAVATMEVTGFQVLGEADQVVTREELLGKFPMLAEKTTWLSSIDKITKTDANTWEFFSQGKLILILGMDAAGQIIVVNSTGGFTADMITLVSDASEQKEMSHHLTFLLSECTAPEKEEEQKQEEKAPVEQAPEKQQPEEQKQEEQKQEGGKMSSLGAPEEAPVKETPKEDEKQEEKVCGAVKAVLHFKEVIQDKEQDQKQEEKQEEQKQEEKAPVAPAPEEDQKQAPEEQKQG